MLKKRRRIKKKKTGLYILIPLVIVALTFSGLFAYRLFRESQYIATVVIDPGHGGYDVGSIGNDGTYEKDMTLEIALRIGKNLKDINPDIKVLYTRTDDNVDWADNEADDLAGRVIYAQQQEADYFLSIHLNASENMEAYGYNAFIRSNDVASKTIAESIEANLSSSTLHFNRGIEFTDTNPLYVVNNQTIPSMLFEVGFITNPNELANLKKTSTQEFIARSIATAYNDYILSTLETADQ